MQHRTVKTHRTIWIQKLKDRAQECQRSGAQNSEFSAQVYEPHMCEANLSSFQLRLKTEVIFELLPIQERNSL